MMRFLRGKEEPMILTDRLETDLVAAKQRLADLEQEAEEIQDLITSVALAGDAEEFVAAQIRRVALPVLITRAGLAVVEAELAIVREENRGAVEELEEARARFEPLHARWFALSRGERKALGKAERALYGAEKKVRALEEREEPLLARKAALEEAGREWPSPEGGTREGAA